MTFHRFLVAVAALFAAPLAQAQTAPQAAASLPPDQASL